MAQSATTVTNPNPTPPTNLSSVGGSPPNVPNYTKNTYIDQVTYPPPFYDDGTPGALTAIATRHAALASGTSTTSGGTENTYPGTGTGVNAVGAVPAASTTQHEGYGTEVVVTAPGSRSECPTQSLSVLGDYTTTPNAQHASSLSPAATTLTSINPTSTAAAVGTVLQTCTGVGFTSQSVMYVNGVAQTTTFVSSTSLTATVTKKTTAGTWNVMVRTAGIVETAPQVWTFT